MSMQRSLKRRTERKYLTSLKPIVCACGAEPYMKHNCDTYVIYCAKCQRIAKGLSRAQAILNWNSD